MLRWSGGWRCRSCPRKPVERNQVPHPTQTSNPGTESVMDGYPALFLVGGGTQETLIFTFSFEKWWHIETISHADHKRAHNSHQNNVSVSVRVLHMAVFRLWSNIIIKAYVVQHRQQRRSRVNTNATEPSETWRPLVFWWWITLHCIWHWRRFLEISISRHINSTVWAIKRRGSCSGNQQLHPGSVWLTWFTESTQNKSILCSHREIEIRIDSAKHTI